MVSPTPPDAQVGLPSEEEIARIVCRRVHEVLHPDAEVWRPGELDIRIDQYWPHFVPEAQRILSLIRPAFEDRGLLDQRINRQRLRIAELERKDADWKRHCDAAEAKLAQAVEDEREACAKLAAANTDNDSRGDCPWDGGSGGMGYRKACYDIEEAIRARSAAARGEKR